MKLTVGTKLASAVCSGQVIVIKAPSAEGELASGGVRMTAAGEDAVGADPLDAAQSGHALAGKRYVDADTGLEVLCTKTGKGSLAFDARPLTLKEAKPLPASD